MEIPKASRKQLKKVQTGANLNEAQQAQESSVKMYENLSASISKLGDMAMTSAINSKIREASLAGEIEGAEGAKSGTGGYEKKSEIFKWDVASNKSAKASFESGVSARSSGAVKDIAKHVDGDSNAYKTLSNTLLQQSLEGITDENQRSYIKSSYDKSYFQNLHTVRSRGIVKQGKRAKDGWDAGNEVFEEDYGIVLQSMARKEKERKTARKEGDYDKADKLDEEIETSREQLRDFKKARMKDAYGAIELGVLSFDGAKRDTHSSIVEAIITTTKQSYAEAKTSNEKSSIRRHIRKMPEKPRGVGKGDEIVYMSPRSKEKLIKALDDQELQEQKMWKSSIAREDKEYEMDKKELMDEINAQMLDDDLDELTLDDLSDALDLGYIDNKEYVDYRDRIQNGDPVLTDDLDTYATIKNGIEDWDVATIAKRQDLTPASRKALIADRTAWEEKGENWMTLPAFTKGRGIVRDTYGFPDKGIMPEFLTHKERQRYTEMVEIEQEYRALVQEAVENGQRYNGIKIAEELMKNQKEDLTSTLFRKYVDTKMIKHKTITEEIKRTGDNLSTILTKQIIKNPDTYYDGKRSGGKGQVDEPKKAPVKEETRAEAKIRRADWKKRYEEADEDTRRIMREEDL